MSELGTVEREIAKLIRTDSTKTVVLLRTFLAGCYEKAEEIDDSTGSFGQFVDELYCGWIKARQTAGADPGETAIRLLGWMEEDPYGFCHELEKNAAKVLDRAGLAAFVKQGTQREAVVSGAREDALGCEATRQGAGIGSPPAVDPPESTGTKEGTPA